MADDYAPFPELELLVLEKWHYERVRLYGEDADVSAVKTIRAAVAAHVALRDRCLRAELERDHGVTP